MHMINSGTASSSNRGQYKEKRNGVVLDDFLGLDSSPFSSAANIPRVRSTQSQGLRSPPSIGAFSLQYQQSSHHSEVQLQSSSLKVVSLEKVRELSCSRTWMDYCLFWYCLKWKKKTQDVYDIMFWLHRISFCRPKMLQGSVLLLICPRKKDPLWNLTKSRKWLKAPMQIIVLSRKRLGQWAVIRRVPSFSKRHLYKAMNLVRPQSIFSKYSLVYFCLGSVFGKCCYMGTGTKLRKKKKHKHFSPSELTYKKIERIR